MLLTQAQEDGGEMAEEAETPAEAEEDDGDAELARAILLLIDAENGFNLLNRLSMLWTIRH